jgi:hypothetical protein
MQSLDRVFSRRRNERLVFFGHVEISPDGTARYVVQDRNNNRTFEVLLSWLQDKGKEYAVEVMFVGCRTFAGGASGGVLHTVSSGSVPHILASIRSAKTRLEVYASFSEQDNPAFINPEKLVAELSAERQEIKRVRDNVPVAIYARPPKPAPPMSSPPFSPAQDARVLPTNPAAGTRDTPWRPDFGEIVLFLLALLILEVGLLDPLNQIVKYQNYRHGRFSRLRRLLNRVAIDAQKLEPSDPSQGQSVIGGVGCLLLLMLLIMMPVSFAIDFWIGLVIAAVLVIFFIGQYCRTLNEEYER